MSGIIGGAGSKSGIIGTTELDYEEGTWIALDYSDVALSQSTALTYTKVGRTVTIQIDVRWTSNTNSLMKGLPFVNIGGHHGSAFAMTDAGGVRSLLIMADNPTGNINALLYAYADPSDDRFIGSFTYQSA